MVDATIQSNEPIKPITIYNNEGGMVKTIDCVNTHRYDMNMQVKNTKGGMICCVDINDIFEDK